MDKMACPRNPGKGLNIAWTECGSFIYLGFVLFLFDLLGERVVLSQMLIFTEPDAH